MKKKKNLLKTLALCSALGLGVGYAVVSSQELTYTEHIPVGTRAINVVINDENASVDGLTLEYTHQFELFDEGDNYKRIMSAVPLINNETDIDAQISAEITVYADNEVISITHSVYGFEDPDNPDEYHNVLSAGTEDRYYFQYAINIDDIATYSTIKVVIKITATPIDIE